MSCVMMNRAENLELRKKNQQKVGGKKTVQ